MKAISCLVLITLSVVLFASLAHCKEVSTDGSAQQVLERQSRNSGRDVLEVQNRVALKGVVNGFPVPYVHDESGVTPMQYSAMILVVALIAALFH